MLAWLVAVILAVVAFALYGLPAAHEHILGPDADDEALVAQFEYKPAEYPGAGYMATIYGKTRYYLFGNAQGPRVVLVHGFSTPSVIFTHVAHALADAGYHVLTYDLHGRGYSDAPGAMYGETLHTMQLYLLLQHVGWPTCHVVGLSMGGAISTSFAHNHPRMVQSLTLLAPAGLMAPYELGTAGQILAHPLVSNVFVGLLSKALHVPTLFNMVVNKLPVDAEWRLKRVVLDQVRVHRGFTRAIVSSIHHYPLMRLHHAYDGVGKQAFPVLVVWGDLDTVVPFRANADRLKWHIPRAQLHVIEGAGHEAVFTHGERVADTIKQFLQLQQQQ